MKFKVNDELVIVSKRGTCYNYIDGDKCVVLRVEKDFDDLNYRVRFENGEECWIYENEAELIEPMFTKSDLKSGMLVVKRNGNVELLIGEYFMDKESGHNCLSSINEDLTNGTGYRKQFDIVEVYDIHSHTIGSFKSDSFDIERLTSLYKREETKVIKKLTIEDIQNKLGYEFKIIKGDK